MFPMPKTQLKDTRKGVPHNLEAERALLGSILLDNAALDLVSDQVSREDLYSESHRLIYDAMHDLSEKSQAIDVVTISEVLMNRSLLDRAGGAPYIAALTDGVPIGTFAALPEYCRIIRDKSILRRLIHSSNHVITRCLDAVDDPSTLVDLAQSQAFEIAEQRVQAAFSTLPQIIKEEFTAVENLFERKLEAGGIRSGFTAIDEMTSGFQPSELIIIAARPSLGKTALALNMAVNAATRDKKKVGLFSLEMSKRSLAVRLLCADAMVDSHRLRTGYASKLEWNKLMNALGRLKDMPLYIDDTDSLSVMQLRARARRLKREHGLDLLIVDYLQLLQAGGRQENRTQEVSYVSRNLKSIAKELRVPVIALSQLSRASDTRAGSRPGLSDLRESGSIEQDADTVMFLYRDRDKPEPEAPADGSEPLGIDTKVLIGKQRNGPTGESTILFLKGYTRFVNKSEHSTSEVA